MARAELMDDATAQVTPMELTTRLHEEAMKMDGAETIFGEVTGVHLADVTGDEQKEENEEEVIQKVTGVEVGNAFIHSIFIFIFST